MKTKYVCLYTAICWTILSGCSSGNVLEESTLMEQKKETKLVPYRDGDTWGFSDRKGNILVETVYDAAWLFGDGYGRIQKDGLTGLVSPEGNVIVDPKYSFISEFKDERAVFMKENGQYGYLDEEGVEVIPAFYDMVFDFQDGVGFVTKNDQTTMIRKDGSQMAVIGRNVPYGNEPLMDMDESWLPVQKGFFRIMDAQQYTVGLVDTLGNIRIRPQFAMLSNPVSGTMVAMKGDMQGLIRLDGSVVLPFDFSVLYRISDGLFIAQKAFGSQGIIDTTGREIVPYGFDYISIGPKGTLIASKFEKAGLINFAGEEIIPFVYQSLYPESDEFLVATNASMKSGILNKKGEVIVPLEYDNISLLNSDRFLADKNGKRGIIDRQGKWILQPEYDISFIGGDMPVYWADQLNERNVVLLSKNQKSWLFTGSGKKLSEKMWQFCSYPDAFGMVWATDAAGRESCIGPDGTIYAKDPPIKKIIVRTAQELIHAIGNDTEITLSPGTYDLGEVTTGNEFVEITTHGNEQSIEIRNVRNLTILSSGTHEAEIVTPYVYVPVLTFEMVNNVILNGIVMGHTAEPGMCEGAVLTVRNGSYFQVLDCDLYGSGAYGIEGKYFSRLIVENATIRECTYGLLDLESCSEVRFYKSVFRDTKEFDLIVLRYCYEVYFEQVQFINNHSSDEWGPYDFFQCMDSFTKFTIRQCSFQNCSADYLTTFETNLVNEGSDLNGFTARKSLFRYDKGKE